MSKTFYRTALLFSVITFLAQCSPDQEVKEEIADFSYLQKHFSSPPAEYSTGPFWVWNDLVTKDIIDQQLDAFSKENIKQVFVHPRPGLITEYLSDEWFYLFEYTVEKASDMGMKVWMYDENSFPSGFGGGHVQEQMPESYNQGDALKMFRGEKITDNPEDYFIVFKQVKDSFFRIKELPAIPSNDYYAFKIFHEPTSGWYGGFSYVDLLIPGVTEKFIEVTMPGYEKVAGEYFGKEVPGIFTDEPNISPRGAKQAIKYTPALFDAFKNRWSYDLKPHLPALFVETGEYKKVRYHYYRLLLELFIERWSIPWYEYTESKNLIWTGHYWEHGWPNPHHGGDNMAMAAWHQMPGIDMLFNSFEQRPDQFGNVRAVKEISSVANQMGRKRTLSETYGGSGWDLSFFDMKRLGDWQHTLGVNFMNQHLSYMTLKGRRKGDFPQSFLTHSPYWEDFGVLAEYFARLSFALSQGMQINKTLILEPTTTAWMYYSPYQSNGLMDSIENNFRALLDKMEKLHLEYDLGAENIIQHHGDVSGSNFIIGERAYTTVILPPYFENIDSITWQYLKTFVENGGQVYSFSVPAFINGEPSADASKLYQTSSNWITMENFSDNEILDRLKAPDFEVSNTNNIQGKTYHMRRILKDGMLLFWSNFNKEGSEEISFFAKGKAVSLFDPLSGEIKAFPAEYKNGSVNVKFKLEAAGSMLFFIHNEETQQPEVTVEQELLWAKLETPHNTILPTALNSITIDYLDLTIDGKMYASTYFSAAADSAYKLNGLEQYGRTGINPWAVAVQYKTNILDMGEKFDENSGYSASYKFNISNEYNPEHLQAVIEWAHLYQVSINGKEIEPLPDTSWLDHNFNIFDIAPHTKQGINELTLSITPMHIHAEIEPVYLRGDFSVKTSPSGFTLHANKPLELGSWAKQGMPFYSQSVKYTKKINAEESTAYKVVLNNWNGTVARIKINGDKVGIIGWKPFEFDLTPYLQRGEQEITVEVVGSLRNLLGPHHGKPRQGIVTPWSWFYAAENLPPGDTYQFVNYGLMEDFDIYVQKQSK